MRQSVRQHAVTLGFSIVEQTKIVTAASELGRNIIVHGGGEGTATIESSAEALRKELKVIFEDNGPGIPDFDKALSDGYTTGEGLGLGLGGSKRLVNNFEIENKPEGGIRVTICRWK